MTAQVFRNGQQPTFYVSDAISPGTGGLDGTFAHLTVTREENIIVNTATGAYPPLNIISTGTTSPAIGMQLLDTVSGSSGSFGLNTAEANDTVFMAGSLGVGAKILTDNIERIRIPASGISVDLSNATGVLAQIPGNPVLFSRTMASGIYTPVWVTASGFSAVGTLSGIYSQNGNVVTVNIQVVNVTTAVGINVASVTLPVLPPNNFVTGTEAVGVLTMNTDVAADAAAGFISARPATKVANVSVSAATIASAPLTISFQYLLA